MIALVPITQLSLHTILGLALWSFQIRITLGGALQTFQR